MENVYNCFKKEESRNRKKVFEAQPHVHFRTKIIAYF